MINSKNLLIVTAVQGIAEKPNTIFVGQKVRLPWMASTKIARGLEQDAGNTMDKENIDDYLS